LPRWANNLRISGQIVTLESSGIQNPVFVLCN
jgi:hypothetical protein